MFVPQKKRSRIRVTAERVQFLNAGVRRDGSVADDVMGMEEDSAPYAASLRQNYVRPAAPAPQARGNYQRTQYDVTPSYGNAAPKASAVPAKSGCAHTVTLSGRIPIPPRTLRTSSVSMTVT